VYLSRSSLGTALTGPWNSLPDRAAKAGPKAPPRRASHEPFTRGEHNLLDQRILNDRFDARCAGTHAASTCCQRFSYNLPGGRDSRQEKQSAIDRDFETVESYATHPRARVVGHRASSRLDSKQNPVSPMEIFSTAQQDWINRGPRGRC